MSVDLLNKIKSYYLQKFENVYIFNRNLPPLKIYNTPSKVVLIHRTHDSKAVAMELCNQKRFLSKSVTCLDEYYLNVHFRNYLSAMTFSYEELELFSIIIF